MVNMQDGKGLVSTEDLQRVCDEFEMGVSRHTLDGLMEFCDVDNDGIINFVEFANYLNWKDKMLIKPKEQRILLNGPLLPSSLFTHLRSGSWTLKVHLSNISYCFSYFFPSCTDVF